MVLSGVGAIIGRVAWLLTNCTMAGGGAPLGAQWRSETFQVPQVPAGSSPWRTRWRRVCSASSRLAMAAMAACTMGQLSALALVMNTVRVGWLLANCSMSWGSADATGSHPPIMLGVCPCPIRRPKDDHFGVY